jgi:hypothetical protein
MINKRDLELILQKRPFTPFRLHFSNGSRHDVTHPDNVLLSDRVAGVAQGDSMWFVAMGHIGEIEPLASIHA